MEKQIAVAIDGPSGAGKSTIARAIAVKMGFVYVDTGALYRSIGLAAQRHGVAGDDAAQVCALLPTLQLRLRYADGQQRVLLGEEDVSDAIRTHEISKYASQVSAIPQVRAYLLDLQRSMAQEGSVIMDGRDIGTVILPQADVKIFLTASAEKRAERRHRELMEKGQSVPYDQVLQDMIARDKQDESRAAAPLKAAEDAVRVDTSDLDLEQSIARICDEIAKKL